MEHISSYYYNIQKKIEPFYKIELEPHLRDMASICIKHASADTTEDEVRDAFKEYPVKRVDIVQMKDYKGHLFANIFVHFLPNDKAMELYELATKNCVHMGEWRVLPNFRPVSELSIRVYTDAELEEFARFKRATEKKS
jgi:hypothetical protein